MVTEETSHSEILHEMMSVEHMAHVGDTRDVPFGNITIKRVRMTYSACWSQNLPIRNISIEVVSLRNKSDMSVIMLVSQSFD
jgi:hypothetical protein